MMVPNILENGEKGKLMAKESSFIQMETTTKVIGAIIKLVVMAFTFMKTGISMRESGRTMFSTVMVRKGGQTAQAIKGPIIREQNMELAFISGQTDRSTTGTGIIM